MLVTNENPALTANGTDEELRICHPACLIYNQGVKVAPIAINPLAVISLSACNHWMATNGYGGCTNQIGRAQQLSSDLGPRRSARVFKPFLFQFQPPA